jgi:D-glycero-D-manno-heptose 1,7-bisphosphate phosphatase
MKPKLKCIFFDRDGSVNRHPGPGYVERWEDFHLLPEFVEVLRLVRQQGYEAVIVSNQRGVARGIMTAATVDDLHRRLRTVLKEQHGLELLDVFYCPHDPDQCECRKPKPGMLLEAARRHGIDLSQSWMIGDSLKDVEAGKAAGCRTILVHATETSDQADKQVSDMAALRSSIAKILEGR